MLAENERTRRLDEMRENRAVKVIQVRKGKRREEGGGEYGSDHSVVDSIVAP